MQSIISDLLRLVLRDLPQGYAQILRNVCTRWAAILPATTINCAELFTTPRTPRPSEVARGFGLKAVVVETVGELRAALRDSASQAGVTVIEAVPSAPVTNVEFHAWLERSLSRIANETVQNQ